MASACVQVPACGGDRSVPEGLLHRVDGRTPVEAVARVGMAQSKGVLRFTHENDRYRDLLGSRYK